MREQLTEAVTKDPRQVAEDATYDLIVVIVNWNARELLLKCLESVSRDPQGLRVRIVVVDNASADFSADMVASTFPQVELVRSAQNLGFARANNRVLDRYRDKANYFLLLNPDTTVPEGGFRKMVEFMEEHRDAGVAGCKITTPTGTLDWACKRGYLTPELLFYKAVGLDKVFPKSPKFGAYHLTYLNENQMHEVDSVVGAFMMIRRECLVRAGLLDESFFIFGEDIEYCYRAKALGWKVFYAPVVTIIHHKGHSTGKRSYRMIRHWYESAWKLYRKQIANRYPAVVNCLVWIGFQLMCGASLVANVFRLNKRVPSRR